MKKFLHAALVTAMLLGMGTALGQADDSHDVRIRIPEVLALRITDGSGNTAATDPSVEFDFLSGTAFDDYLAALDAGSAWLAPTAVNNFGDVVVFANRGTWRVGVSATAFTFTDDVVLGELAAGIVLADIRVMPTGSVGLNVSNVAESWDMTGGEIADGVRTQGWRSLGFSGDDYEIFVDGDEAPGSYLTVVTYTITAP